VSEYVREMMKRSASVSRQAHGAAATPRRRAHAGRFSTAVKSVIGIAALLLALPLAASAAVPAAERQALTNLYTSTGGGAWTVNTNWCSGACPASGAATFNAAGSECSWYGIACDAAQAHVIAIALPANNLAGTLPPLTAFVSLEYFSVASNRLGGALPALASLTHLQAFHAGDNAFTGALPILSGLTGLGDFAVPRNQLSGAIPSLSGLVALYRFDVAGNRLTGSVPALTGLAGLREFDASDNQLSGTIGTPSAAAALLRLGLERNSLSGTIPVLPPNLYSAQLGFNRLSGAVPAAPATLYTPAAFASSTLCPNPLTISASANDAGWNAATGFSPWWATPFASNRCDDLQADGFE
jgi:hypothetical protein